MLAIMVAEIKLIITVLIMITTRIIMMRPTMDILRLMTMIMVTIPNKQ